VGASAAVAGEDEGNVRTRGVAAGLVAALALTAGACSDDDDAADPSTTLTATTAPPETSASVVATGAPTTVATTPTPTAAPTTTQSVDQFNAEVSAAFLALEDKIRAILMNPKAPDMGVRIAEVAVPDTPYANQITARVNDLNSKGQSVRSNIPDIRKLTVERINVLDPPANTQVNVTYCQVSNAILVKNADDSPIPGRSIPVGGTGELSASRYTVDLVRTPDGWRHSGAPGNDSISYPNATDCPAP
jgi:hypothetical protein